MARSSPHFLRYGCSSGRFSCDGNAYDEGASLAVFVVAAEDFSPVGTDDAIANAEAQARAFRGLFCGVKGVEDTLGVRNAGAVVGDGNFDVLFVSGGVNHNAAALSRILNGVISVIQNIQEDLLQLLRVAECWREIFVEVFGDLDAVASEIVAARFDGLAEDIVDVNELALHGALAGEAEQVLDNVFGALGFVQDDLEIFAGILGYRGVLQQQIGET